MKIKEEIELELTKEQKEDLDYFKKKFLDARLYRYRGPTPKYLERFLFLGCGYVIGITNRFFNENDDAEKDALLPDSDKTQISDSIMEEIRPFMDRVVLIVKYEKRPFNLKLKSGLWLVVAPRYAKVEE